MNPQILNPDPAHRRSLERDFNLVHECEHFSVVIPRHYTVDPKPSNPKP